MIKDKKYLEEFERSICENSKPDYFANLKIFEELLAYAKSLGKFPPENPLEGLEVDIRIAKILNSVK